MASPHPSVSRSGGARLRAIEALLAWEEGRAETVADALGNGGGGPDGGLARELALGAVTWTRLYDHLADRFLKPGRQPPALRWCLRLAAHQLFALDRIPPHAAVGESVEALRAVGEPRLTGVANAIARRLASLRQDERNGDGPLGRLRAEDAPTDPGTRHSLPDLLIDDLRPVAPHEDFAACLAALNHLPPMCTRIRHEPIAGRSIVRRDGAWLWWEDPAEALALVADGRLAVQDFAQGEVVELAQPRPGERVLDLCAAPGGKSRALIERHARVISADVSQAKVRELDADLVRVVQDGARPAFADGTFDVVVVDAPCSNSGVLARRPEARWRYDRRHLAALEGIQTRLLRAAAPLVAPGGRLVYATCSLSPRENQAITHRLDGWRILAERLTWPGPWHLGGYACCLVRAS